MNSLKIQKGEECMIWLGQMILKGWIWVAVVVLEEEDLALIWMIFSIWDLEEWEVALMDLGEVEEEVAAEEEEEAEEEVEDKEPTHLHLEETADKASGLTYEMMNILFIIIQYINRKIENAKQYFKAKAYAAGKSE